MRDTRRRFNPNSEYARELPTPKHKTKAEWEAEGYTVEEFKEAYMTGETKKPTSRRPSA